MSVGGYPKDIDFIQTHKALEHAKQAAKKGATIILLGQCRDGIGNPYFLPLVRLSVHRGHGACVRESDKVYAQTAYSTRIKAEAFNIVLVSTRWRPA